MLMGSLHLMDTAQGSTSGCVQMECVKSVPFQLANCLCISGGASPPNFVGSDYCCESGLSATPWRNALYSNDPLWDGQGCNGLERTCCSPPNLPWFCKELPEPTTDDLELRLCGDYVRTNEDTPIELVELYIQ